MKIIVPLWFLLAWSVATVRADVVIYRLKQTGKFIGASNEFALRGAGFVILDPDTKQGYTVQSARLLGVKFFTTASSTNTRVYNVSGAKGKSYTVFAGSFLDGTRDRNQITRGQNAPLAITPTRTINFPRVITGSAGTVNFGALDTEAFLVEGKATATFSLPDTRTANADGETVSQVLQRIQADLIAQGYESFEL